MNDEEIDIILELLQDKHKETDNGNHSCSNDNSNISDDRADKLRGLVRDNH